MLLLFLIPCLVLSLFNVPVSVNGAARPKCTKIHVINRGEQFSRIAKEYGLTERRLLELNPMITDAHQILSGDRICVETSVERAAAAAATTTTTTANRAVPSRAHAVRKAPKRRPEPEEDIPSEY
ncbi:hypothetical protein BV898_12237 [Hypsibius exemplaris]|uniref:LysM domain-containing protein n=1 Tax=Hypsibius exemplaris TaxID=2072580 RepID=A0A1W0WE73_HYPEX|nr:hypothetical protein BV898_12237 [Hypsibius exemplaris]